MSKIYANMIQLGKITIDDVPARWLDEVKKLLGIDEEDTADSE